MDEKNTIELLKILEIIRKRIVIVLVIPIVAALITGLINYFYLRPIYEARQLVIVGVNDSSKIDPGSISLYEGILSTCLEIAKSPVVAENAAAKLNNQISPGALQGGLNVSIKPGTQMLIFSFVSYNPKDAVKKVEAMTQAFIEEEGKLLSNAKVQIMDTAKLPTSPVAPNKKKNIMMAFLGGLVVAIGIALFMEMFDRTIKNEEDVRRYLDIPVVGIIPKHNGGKI